MVFGTIGWLFADLMFALAIAFLVATTVGQPPPPAVPPPPPPSATPGASRPAEPSPSTTPQPALELKPLSFEVQIDWQGLLSGDQAAQAALLKKVRSEPGLSGRRAGLVLTFGGDSGGSPAQAIAIAEKVDSVLQELGDQQFVFSGTVFRPFLALNSPPGIVQIDIYLFKLNT
jgi:hypothetical protein